MKTVCFLLTMPSWSKEQDAKISLTGTYCYSKPFVGTSQQNTSVCYEMKRERMYLFLQDGILQPPKKCMYACMYVCTWGSLRRRVLSVGLSLSPGQNLSLEKDSQAAAGSWWGFAIPSSVTRQHYQRCCTCAPDINYHFLLAVYIFIYTFSCRNMKRSRANEIFVERMSVPIS